jgi:putative transposase
MITHLDGRPDSESSFWSSDHTLDGPSTGHPPRGPIQTLQHREGAADNTCVVSSAQKQASAARRAENRARGLERAHPRVRARPIYPGRSYKVTRRCVGRMLLLSPGDDAKADELTNFIGYCLGRAAERYGIEVHASVWMSNHHYTDITDPEGNLVPFKQMLHSMIARGRNARIGRQDTFWSGDDACDTRRPTDDESLRDLVYTVTNPVKAGLVKWGRLWTGFTTAGWKFGETRTFKRPSWFFDKRGEMPETVSLTLVRPPIFAELDDDALYEKLIIEVRAREVEIQREFRRKGRRFMGRKKLAKQGWSQVPRSFEERFGVTPKYAGSSKWLVLAELQRDREWERQYATARELLRAGKPAVFPVGTYWMRCFAGVVVAQSP